MSAPACYFIATMQSFDWLYESNESAINTGSLLFITVGAAYIFLNIFTGNNGSNLLSREDVI